MSMQTLLEYSRIFGRQKMVDSHMEINWRFCKHNLNCMKRLKSIHGITFICVGRFNILLGGQDRSKLFAAYKLIGAPPPPPPPPISAK